MEAPTITPEAVPGQEPIPGSPQVTDPGAQAQVQPQSQTPSQVEDGNLNASNQDNTGRASDFETARQLKRLAKQMQSMQNAFERSQQSAQSPGYPQAPQSQAPQLTNDDVIKDPIGALKRLVQAELQPFRNEIPQHIQSVIATQKMQVAEQEALKLIRTNGSVKADPEGEDRIAEILYEEDTDGNSLNKYSSINPKHAAQLALSEYNARYGGNKRSQSVPTKAQMQTTATAVTQNAPQANLEQEAALLYRQVLADPSLMQDKDYKAKLDAFSKKAKMETLLKNQ